MQTFIFALISYSKTKTWSADIPEYLRTPMKSRGEIAYVVDRLPDGPPTDGSICPYVFLRVVGMPDSIGRPKLNEVLRRASETMVDSDGTGRMAMRMDRRCDARINFSLLPNAARLALLTPGNSATVTMEEFATACELHSKGRELRPADLA
jgi:hypothetical protein